jgi:hypothetical protein
MTSSQTAPPPAIDEFRFAYFIDFSLAPTEKIMMACTSLPDLRILPAF